MSRTKRNHYERSAFGKYYIFLKERQFGHDKKDGSKAPGWYKRMKQRIQRSKAKQAMREGRDPERVRHENDYNWS